MTNIIYSTKIKYYYQHEFNEWGNMKPGDYWRTADYETNYL